MCFGGAQQEVTRNSDVSWAHVSRVDLATYVVRRTDLQLAVLPQQLQEGLLVDDAAVGALALEGDDPWDGRTGGGGRQACRGQQDAW